MCSALTLNNRNVFLGGKLHRTTASNLAELCLLASSINLYSRLACHCISDANGKKGQWILPELFRISCADSSGFFTRVSVRARVYIGEASRALFLYVTANVSALSNPAAYLSSRHWPEDVKCWVVFCFFHLRRRCSHQFRWALRQKHANLRKVSPVPRQLL